jgi:hypothetical protein
MGGVRSQKGNKSSSHEAMPPSPRLLALAYSAPFAVTYAILAAIVAAFVLNNSISNKSGYGVIIACVAAYAVGWLFARRRRRAFTSTEAVWLVIWSSLWMLLFESAAYVAGWSVITYHELVYSLPAPWRPLVIGLGFALNVYVLSFVVRRHVVKMMNNRVKVSS